MKRIRLGRWLAGVFILLLLALAGLYVGSRLVYGDLKSWVESPDFRQLLSHQVSRALKVHGEFGEITLEEGMTARAESFESISRGSRR